MNIYVGNLGYSVSEERLSEIFSEYGTVVSVKIITDKFTGKSRGFGFVEIDGENNGNKAIEGLHETEVEGRKLVVNKAREKPQNNRRGQNR